MLSLLSRHPATAAYSLLDLGNQVGAVTNVGDTPETVNNPTCRLRKLANDAHRAFTGAEIKNGVATSWANEDVVTYESDFSAGIDSWGAGGGTIAAPTTIGGESNALEFTDSTTFRTYYARFPNNSLPVGIQFLVEFDYYIPSTNTKVDRIAIWDNATNLDEAPLATPDTWIRYSGTVTIATGDIRVHTYSGSGGVSYSGVGDKLYIKNATLTQLTSSAALVTLYDQSGNGYHATQASAGAQPLVIENGVLVTDANGNPSVKFDGVDDSFVVSMTPYASLQNWALFTVVQQPTSTSEELVVMGAPADRNYITTESIIYGDVPDSATWSLVGNNAYLISLTASGGTLSARVNNALQDTATTTTSGAGDYLLIGRDIGATQYGAITLGAFLLYGTDQSANRPAIESSLTSTFGPF